MTIKALVLAIPVAVMLSSCGGGDGPRGNVYVADKTIDEMVNDVLEAQESDGWVELYDVDLYTRVDGEWYYAGRKSVFMGLHDDSDCNLWVDFDHSGYKMPVYPTDDYGYRFKTQWHGDWYYF